MQKKPEIRSGFSENLWKFLASVKLSAVILLSLAALSIIGTLIPQNQSPADYLRAFGPFLYQMMAILGLFDMYHSWWFQGFVVFLVVNILICSIDRLQKTGKVIFDKNPRFNLEQFRQRKARHDFKVSRSPDALQDPFTRTVARAFGYFRVNATDQGFVIGAEKGRWTRLGAYIVHFSIVVLLVGALIGSHFGFEGYVNIPEGESTNTIQLRSSFGFEGYVNVPEGESTSAIQLRSSKTLPFTIRCDDFDVQFYEGGQRPKEFRSKLTILENGKPVLQKDIIVNDPLRYQGINIFQSSYGQLSDFKAPVAKMDEPPAEIELNLRSSASGMIYNARTAIGKEIKIPEGLGTLVITGYQPEAKFKGMDLGPSFTAVLTKEGGPPQPIVLPLKFPKFDVMRGGEVIISVSGDFATPEPDYFTGLQVTKDPGVSLVYTGFILLIAGCAVTFFMSHQQVMLEVQSSKKGSVVMVSGFSNKNKLGFQQKLQRIADTLKRLGSD
jgi:cytochrome c biogenesis protein